jgi:hypothetical protein
MHMSEVTNFVQGDTVANLFAGQNTANPDQVRADDAVKVHNIIGDFDAAADVEPEKRNDNTFDNLRNIRQELLNVDQYKGPSYSAGDYASSVRKNWGMGTQDENNALDDRLRSYGYSEEEIQRTWVPSQSYGSSQTR